MAVGVFAEKGEYDSLFLSNYLDVYVQGRAEARPRRQRRHRSSASASIRCGCGSTPIASPRARSPPTTSSTALREQNVQVAAGSVGQAPAPSGQMYQLSVRAVGRLREAGRVREHHRQERRRRLARAAEGRRPRRARRRNLRLAAALPGARSRRLRRHPAADGQRPGRRERGRGGDGAAGGAVPARDALPRLVQHDRRRRGVDPRSHQDAARSDRARRPRHLRLPADVAQHDHPGDHDPGLARSARSRSSS